MSETSQYLHHKFSRLHRFRREGDLDDGVPDHGVYVVFERGEHAHGVERIVRVGTNAGKAILASRIREHYRANKDRSIFRKHVGRALLKDDPFLDEWDIDLTTREAGENYAGKMVMVKLAKVESEVTYHMKENISFAFLRHDANPLSCERLLLSTIHSYKECGPSAGWLGKDHPNFVIKVSGLWNIQGLKGPVLSPPEAGKLI
jgi:hypothetical protein